MPGTNTGINVNNPMVVAAFPGTGTGALAVHRATLTIWHFAAGADAWSHAHAMNVPIQFRPLD
jgi:hypothetical protein